MTVSNTRSPVTSVLTMKKADILSRGDTLVHCPNSSANAIIDEHSVIDTIPPRTFNRLDFSATTVTKTSVDTSILGEIFFYRHIPSYLSCHFPRLVDSKLPPDLDLREASLTIERIYGATFSKMAVCDKLAAGHIRQLLVVLHRLHTAEHAPVNDASIYKNHGCKVRARRTRHHCEYVRLGLDDGHFDTLLSRLDEYQDKCRGMASAIVHGDPVFTNVLVTCHTSSDDDHRYDTWSNEEDGSDEMELKLIDMRGMQGSERTLQGDAIYDLAKVLQSLLGYDFILSDVDLDHAMARRLSVYVGTFWKYVCEMYGQNVSIVDVVTVCASLWTSLIPLHQDCEQAQLAQRKVRGQNGGLTYVGSASRKILFANVAKIVLNAAVHLDSEAFRPTCVDGERTTWQQSQIEYVVNLPFEIAKAFQNL